MAHEHFLAALAEAQGVGTADDLKTKHAVRFASQINSRMRAREALEVLEERLHLNWNGLRVLDLGCGYGATSIEMANNGAKVVGVDLNPKWLRLADINARDEADVSFINVDAAMRSARREIEQYGPFDLVICNDVFEHIYDTAGLLSNLRAMMAPGATIVFRTANGMATRNVLLERNKKVFGISLLAPDFWSKFVKAPAQIYYRRMDYYRGLLTQYGFDNVKFTNALTDPSAENTKKRILSDIKKIRGHLKAENFDSTEQFKMVRIACRYYFDEVSEDVDTMSWKDLFMKYRVANWEGVAQIPAGGVGAEAEAREYA